ncbi:spermidine/putrescine ABC transporter ATP-binding protein [Halarchaeum acidiphilum MH1-52-1]|uniref:Molybdate/tungstate import ATP-binding protein WtpC n=1 Tax=Halarchaeum acidiphilum MH1-52-1 TaxID=1261545 RepID=U3A4K0_9EURY|nr:spermidine/putrescine ABC transporter ATP-binding protein [Halarchaeum acidiphilum MH1-52-1]
MAALRGIDLGVRDGEFFTLVGPSGCGKTTTLRCIAGLETPDAGAIRFGDTDVSDVPPEARGVGVVFQHYALFPTMTVRENVAYGLRFDPPDGSVDERVAAMLDLVDLAGMGDRDPDELSGGQRQRVALARALAPAPDVLLLDEPLSSLDARLRDRLRLELKRVQRELGVTTVYVTHDQAEALAVSDRLAVVHDGRIAQVGEPEAVYDGPETRFVAEFLGENNCLDGRAVGGETEGSLVRAGETEFAVTGDHRGPVTLCVRPESLDVNASHNQFDARVRDVEFLGDGYRVHFEWNGRDVVARLDDAPTGSVTLGFDPADAVVLER